MSKELISEVGDRGKGFLGHPSNIDDVPIKLIQFCYYHIIYRFMSTRLLNIARPNMLNFSNGCALIPQSVALENVCRMIIH